MTTLPQTRTHTTICSSNNRDIANLKFPLLFQWLSSYITITLIISPWRNFGITQTHYLAYFVFLYKVLIRFIILLERVVPYTAFIFVYLHWFALSRTICFSNAEGGEEKKDFYFFFFCFLIGEFSRTWNATLFYKYISSLTKRKEGWIIKPHFDRFLISVEFEDQKTVFLYTCTMV